MKHYGILFFLLMSVFGCLGPIVRAIGLPSVVVVCLRAWISSLFLLMYIAITGKSFKSDQIKKVFVPMIVSGVLIAGDWLGLFTAYNYTSVANATVCYYIAPVIVLLGCAVFLNEKIQIKGALCVFVSFIGLVLVSGVTKGSSVKGILFSVFGALCYACIIIINRVYPQGDPVVRTEIQLFVAAILTTPYVILTNDINTLCFTPKAIILLLILGVGLTALTYVFYFKLILYIPSGSVAVCSYADPLVSVIMSVFFLGETITFTGVLGSILILGSSLVFELTSGNK